jgi:hypothetical protein
MATLLFEDYNDSERKYTPLAAGCQYVFIKFLSIEAVPKLKFWSGLRYG